ncbi:MAG: DNA repair protein RadC [Bacteroidetes bacterium]|nr:DNA repair protein RadC [Bacteroidota bacterium]MBK7967587.1 DNA repair protein RadC [Bacteroidota bacterium]MBK8876119.1 DNA repair protein RadC [Bacteroidota bacterium]MBK9423316.1 DNA repair protein RadC [Bacteroidota bacterium]MBL0070998.1 DNA repair protein RadC [Bacteroidota bacterium]
MEDSNLKAWAEADRPREKLMNQGRNALSDSELLAILIRSGTKKETAVELSRRILNSVSNDLMQLSRLSISDFMKFKGMGEVKAITVMAALELGRRRRSAEAVQLVKVTSSKTVADLFIPLLSDLNHEEFWVLLLNRANNIIGKHQISKGGLSGTVVDSKVIFKLALESSSSSIIMCHNHPSGNHKPSDADLSLTKRIVEAGKVLDISVLDHLIIAGELYYSFADEGKM